MSDMGINRIRLEFKAALFLRLYAKCCVLIESDWNLKLKRLEDQPQTEKY